MVIASMTDIVFHPEVEHVTAASPRACRDKPEDLRAHEAHWQKMNGGTATDIPLCPLVARHLASFCPRVTIKHVAQKCEVVLGERHA
jgi:hypothetical protein